MSSIHAGQTWRRKRDGLLVTVTAPTQPVPARDPQSFVEVRGTRRSRLRAGTLRERYQLTDNTGPDTGQDPS